LASRSRATIRGWSGSVGLAWLGISGRHLIIFFPLIIIYLCASSALISHAHISWLAHPFVLFLPCPFSSYLVSSFHFYLLCAAYYQYLIVLYSSLPTHQIPCSIYTCFCFLSVAFVRARVLLQSFSCIYVYAYACGGKNGVGWVVDEEEFVTVEE